MDPPKTGRRKKKHKAKEKRDNNPYNRRYVRNYQKMLEKHNAEVDQVPDQQNDPNVVLNNQKMKMKRRDKDI